MLVFVGATSDPDVNHCHRLITPTLTPTRPTSLCLTCRYTVEAKVGGAWQPFSAGTTVGAKRIDLAAAPVSAESVRITVTSAFGVPTGLKASVFAPAPCAVHDLGSQ
jgi:hypothetical protein